MTEVTKQQKERIKFQDKKIKHQAYLIEIQQNQIKEWIEKQKEDRIHGS
tara:strand:- start:2535 stop:2681 length:147 start_codon:yes stop_codon:yes gene_type:complete